jgi:methylated-DNA-[protein]-cysteine S-methyltransferase
LKYTKDTNRSYAYKTMKSPVGQLKLVASHSGLAAILWENEDPKRVNIDRTSGSDDTVLHGTTLALEDKNHPILVETERQLTEYFSGERKSFTLKLDPVGTDFQRRVWKVLSLIPYGQTRSYGEIAKQIGNPQASRAVGGANGRNPISIVIPCHRVIGATGDLTGFGGGLKIKAQLLELEKTKPRDTTSPSY